MRDGIRGRLSHQSRQGFPLARETVLPSSLSCQKNRPAREPVLPAKLSRRRWGGTRLRHHPSAPFFASVIGGPIGQTLPTDPSFAHRWPSQARPVFPGGASPWKWMSWMWTSCHWMSVKWMPWNWISGVGAVPIPATRRSLRQASHAIGGRGAVGARSSVGARTEPTERGSPRDLRVGTTPVGPHRGSWKTDGVSLHRIVGMDPGSRPRLQFGVRRHLPARRVMNPENRPVGDAVGSPSGDALPIRLASPRSSVQGHGTGCWTGTRKCIAGGRSSVRDRTPRCAFS